jgi:hypothetical protein
MTILIHAGHICNSSIEACSSYLCSTTCTSRGSRFMQLRS